MNSLVAAATGCGAALAMLYGAQNYGVPHDYSVALAIVAFVATWFGMKWFLDTT